MEAVAIAFRALKLHSAAVERMKARQMLRLPFDDSGPCHHSTLSD
jgi:hypothetical protein